jgi:chromosome segregation ATPase
MQTDEEQREEQTVQDRLPGLRQAWAAAFAEYRQAQTNAEAGGEQLESLRKRVASLKDDLAHLQEIRNRYQKGYQAHGFVWVFLRK